MVQDEAFPESPWAQRDSWQLCFSILGINLLRIFVKTASHNPHLFFLQGSTSTQIAFAINLAITFLNSIDQGKNKRRYVWPLTCAVAPWMNGGNKFVQSLFGRFIYLAGTLVNQFLGQSLKFSGKKHFAETQKECIF